MKEFRFMPKLAAAIVSVAMIFSGAVPAFAATTDGNTTINTAGNSVKFNTTLSLSMETLGENVQKRIPAKTFKYTVSPGSAVSSSNPIYAGVALSDTKSTVTATIAAQNVTSNQSSVSVDTTVDFSDVQWPQTGIYRYNVTNTDSATSAYTGSGFGKTMLLDVAVVNDSAGTGYKIDHAALVNITTNSDGTTTSSKSDGFVFNYQSKYMKFTKLVAGNQGDHNKDFQFTLNISGATGLDCLNVTTTSTSTNSAAKKSGTIDLTNGSTGDVTFYLKHDEYVVINNLPAGYHFTVNENKTDLTANGYTPSISATTGTLTVDNNNAKASANNVASSLAFNVTNTKSGSVPTGVIFAVAPFAIGAVAITLFVILKVRKAAKQ